VQPLRLARERGGGAVQRLDFAQRQQVDQRSSRGGGRWRRGRTAWRRWAAQARGVGGRTRGGRERRQLRHARGRRRNSSRARLERRSVSPRRWRRRPLGCHARAVLEQRDR
jgi:hypothetical protein